MYMYFYLRLCEFIHQHACFIISKVGQTYSWISFSNGARISNCYALTTKRFWKIKLGILIQGFSWLCAHGFSSGMVVVVKESREQIQYLPCLADEDTGDAN